MSVRSFAAVCAAVICLCSCNKEQAELRHERYYVNTFALGMMSTYYLWSDEIEATFENWKAADDPVQKVKDIRYKDRNGKDIDRWTQMLTSYSETINSMSGQTTSYGYDFLFYHIQENSDALCAVVTLCYPNTPASDAGLKRGDVVLKINGKDITMDNYQALYSSDFLGGSECSLTMMDGRSLEMKARAIYENPVLACKVIDCGAKKVGYLLYTSFTMESCADLIEACKSMKAQGVSELVLDLRYNTGGYVAAENLLASMLAPEAAVENAELYLIDRYNSLLTREWGVKETHFATEHTGKVNGKDYTYSTSGCNLNLDKIYVLTTGSTASASESIIVGLLPYIPIEIIGDQTSGKYCAGIMESAKDWYKENSKALKESKIDISEAWGYCGDWGMYVMISRYADKNGDTPCMPDGFTPGTKAVDTPEDGIALGDPAERLLNIALVKAGYTGPSTREASRAGRPLRRCENQPERQTYRLFEPGSLESL